MFGKLLKAEIAGLKAYIIDLESRLQNIENNVKELQSPEYYEWKSMALANKESAAKQGHWYLNSRTDTQLLEQIISEINNNEDLCALLTTSDGTTLSLRVHPQPNNKSFKHMNFDGDETN